MRLLSVTVLVLLVVYRSYSQSIEVRTFYDSEEIHLKEVIYLLDSQSHILQGPYELYYIDGNLQAKGFYENGAPEGNWEYYFENGNLKMAGLIKDNTNFGKWVFYYENGSKSREGELYNGQRQNEWIFYYENETIKSQGKFIDSQRDGIWNYYYEDGELKGQSFFTKGTGIYKEFYSSGSLKVEGGNQEGKSDGLWKYYFETGELQSEGKFSQGLKVGEWRYYYKNGLTSAAGYFNLGKRQGKWQYFYEDGSLNSEGNLSNDLKDGYWKLFYETGELKGEGQFNEGKGEYKEFHSNGRLKILGHIFDGKNDGLWTYYNDEGALDGEAMFRNGEGVYTGYYPDGSRKTQGAIKDDKKIGEWQLFNEEGQIVGYYHPIYEDESPVYKTTESISDETGRIQYEKPEYRFKNNKLRYFEPIVNEYRGGIAAINPFLTFFGRLPISAEYYIQERLGYELQYTLIRDPFYKSLSSIDLNQNYKRGFSLQLRQKFYHKEGQFGMLYFAHELAFTSISHKAKVVESFLPNLSTGQIKSSEKRFEYGIIVGNRWLAKSGDGGPTIDIFVGIGIGYRNYKPNYSDNGNFDTIFNNLKTSKTSIPLIFGINFGLIRPKREAQ
ncbi:MAG: membrane-binding protein [Bacteroidetes bacterium]|nr:membrane-binding protein [Bacteroidota bacterium]MDA1119838.1 membrane-binding protein [Bacteroidota bacterium]